MFVALSCLYRWNWTKRLQTLTVLQFANFECFNSYWANIKAGVGACSMVQDDQPFPMEYLSIQCNEGRKWPQECKTNLQSKNSWAVDTIVKRTAYSRHDNSIVHDDFLQIKWKWLTKQSKLKEVHGNRLVVKEENECLEVLPRCEKQPREGKSYCIEEKEPEINWQAKGWLTLKTGFFRHSVQLWTECSTLKKQYCSVLNQNHNVRWLWSMASTIVEEHKNCS